MSEAAFVDLISTSYAYKATVFRATPSCYTGIFRHHCYSHMNYDHYDDSGASSSPQLRTANDQERIQKKDIKKYILCRNYILHCILFYIQIQIFSTGENINFLNNHSYPAGQHNEGFTQYISIRRQPTARTRKSTVVATGRENVPPRIMVHQN